MPTGDTPQRQSLLEQQSQQRSWKFCRHKAFAQKRGYYSCHVPVAPGGVVTFVAVLHCVLEQGTHISCRALKDKRTRMGTNRTSLAVCGLHITSAPKACHFLRHMEPYSPRHAALRPNQNVQHQPEQSPGHTPKLESQGRPHGRMQRGGALPGDGSNGSIAITNIASTMSVATEIVVLFFQRGATLLVEFSFTIIIASIISLPRAVLSSYCRRIANRK